MGARSMLPLIDLVFLTLGAILAAMTQMERVTALPLDVARVGSGAAVVRQGRFSVLSVYNGGMTLDGELISRSQLHVAVAGRQIVLRAERALPTQVLLSVLAEMVRAGADVSLEVEETDEAAVEAASVASPRPSNPASPQDTGG